MLINLSNHPSSLWSETQMNVAITQYDHVKDIPFPAINPQWNEQNIQELALEFFEKIIAEKTASDNRFAVHIMGEFSFVFALTSLLLKNDIECVASTTQRKVTYDSNGNKVSDFEFIQFRKYIAP